jgi:hypothetical protein
VQFWVTMDGCGLCHNPLFMTCRRITRVSRFPPAVEGQQTVPDCRSFDLWLFDLSLLAFKISQSDLLLLERYSNCVQ